MAKKIKIEPIHQISAARLSMFHSLFVNKIQTVFGQSALEIRERTGAPLERWSAIQIGEVEFFLTSGSNGQAFAKREREFGEVTPIVVLPVGPFKRQGPPLKWWVAWKEKWSAAGAKHFHFVTAGWILYCSSAEDDHLLLLRAEWDHSDKLRPQNAGQPHWHVHRVLDITHLPTAGATPMGDNQNDLLPAEEVFSTVPQGALTTEADQAGTLKEEPYVGPPPPVSDELVELGIDRTSQVETTGMHLGMAGWNHHPTGKLPLCWQKSLDDDVIKALLDWSLASLSYLQSQLAYIKYRPPTS